MELNGYDITDELIDQIILAQLYKEDYNTVIRKYLGKSIKSSDCDSIYRSIIQSSEYQQRKEDVLAIEKASLIDDDMNTIMLQYNMLQKKAQREGKYEVAARILRDIRQIKSIDNEQMKFEVVIKVEKPEKKEEIKTDDVPQG